MIELAQARRPSEANDLDRPVPLGAGRSTFLVIHADDLHPAAQHRLGMSQGSDRRLDAAAGRIQTLVNKCGFTNVFLGELGGRDRIVPVA